MECLILKLKLKENAQDTDAIKGNIPRNCNDGSRYIALTNFAHVTTECLPNASFRKTISRIKYIVCIYKIYIVTIYCIKYLGGLANFR